MQTMKYDSLRELIIAFVLFTSIAGAFLSATEMSGLLYALLIVGFIVLAAEFIAVRFKRGFLALNVVYIFLLLGSILISPQTVLNGVKLICNNLFTVSEKYQSYQYIRFMVTSTQEYFEIQTMSALLLAASVVAVLAAVAVIRNSMIIYTAMFLIFTGAQIYFGIFPSSAWNVMFYASLAVAAICGSNKKIIIFRDGLLLLVPTLTAICALFYFTYPGANPAILELSETVRDRFSEKIEYYDETKQHKDAPEQKRDEEANIDFTHSISQNNKEAQYSLNFITEFSGSQIGAIVEQSLLAVLVLIILAMSVFASYFAFRAARAVKRKKVFDSPNCALAVDSMFKYLMQILVTIGLKPENNVFSSYMNQLETIISPQYAAEYLKIVSIWLEAVYSDHEITTADKNKMRSFLDETSTLTLKNANLFMRIQIKFLLFFF